MFAGLLSAGLVVLAALLVLSALLSPALLGGTGISRATGPEWWRILVQLGVGVAAELARSVRHRLPDPARGVLAGLVSVAVVVTIAVCWW
ncbi:hypothetical protein GIS00_06980 [Nakamurella sp. YIM 132087]|uniref:Uncharacterized protein n=1 Tax=Nakamurella alba TaxID=2665158 RepID=A0A7K1FHT1_9ACTN|nr:hypothetical protein [Nakamurella alba]MTD13685.1 hypothetical protein [Nakamurella alba]